MYLTFDELISLRSSYNDELNKAQAKLAVVDDLIGLLTDKAKADIDKAEPTDETPAVEDDEQKVQPYELNY